MPGDVSAYFSAAAETMTTNLALKKQIYSVLSILDQAEQVT